MSGGLPWALVVQADELDVHRRAELAASLAELVEFHRHWVLMATCHRVELYGFGASPAQPDMRRLEGDRAVRQLFRVAAGLECAVRARSWARCATPWRRRVSGEPTSAWLGCSSARLPQGGRRALGGSRGHRSPEWWQRRMGWPNGRLAGWRRGRSCRAGPCWWWGLGRWVSRSRRPQPRQEG